MRGSNIVKIGIVGCGDISKTHGNAVMHIDNAQFIACADINQVRAHAWAKKYGCGHYYTDYKKMLDDEDLDAVVLATWPNQHLEQIENCIAAGIKSILCQKSLTITAKEALQIKELADKNGIFLMEGFMYRHHPAIKKLEQLLKPGTLGTVDNVRAVFSDYDAEQEAADDTTRNWRQRKECGGGIPYDFACYAVNACGHFGGGVPVRVYATGGMSEKFGIVNRMYGMIEYDNGCVGIIESSKKCGFSQELQISCAGGILNLPMAWTIYDEIKISETFRSEWGHLHHNFYDIPKMDAYYCEMKNFINTIHGSEKPVVSLDETVRNIFVIEALIKSINQKRLIDVHIPEILKKV